MEDGLLTNHFLIAMPGLVDPNFARTVTLICEHSTEGAMGVVINRMTDLKLRDIFGQLNIDTAGAAHRGEPLALRPGRPPDPVRHAGGKPLARRGRADGGGHEHPVRRGRPCPRRDGIWDTSNKG